MSKEPLTELSPVVTTRFHTVERGFCSICRQKRIVSVLKRESLTFTRTTTDYIGICKKCLSIMI